MNDEGGKKAYDGTPMNELELIGSGWLRETKTGKKHQFFFVNKDVELKKNDAVFIYIAKTRSTSKSPQYYMFLDTERRTGGGRKPKGSWTPETTDPVDAVKDPEEDF